MTAQATPSARNAAPRVPCPHCSYRAENAGSIPAHLAMVHPEVPMDAIAPRRRAAPAGELPEAVHGPDCPDGFHAHVFTSAAPGDPTAGRAILEIPLELVDVGTNVRVTLEAIDELAASIAEHGVLQPVKATLQPDGRYRLLWGQRRVLAARKAGLATVPAIVDTAEDAGERPIEQLVENLHRADLNPIDRATAMRAVVDAGVSQADLARKLGIAPSTVANDLRLLTLDDTVRERIRVGEISASHGKALVSLPPKHQRDLVSRILESKLSAHQIESEIEWRRNAAQGEVKAAERTDLQLPKLLALLEASVSKGTAVQVQSPYNMDRERLRAAVQKAGYTLAERYVRERPARGKCDCSVVEVSFNRAWKVVLGCIDDRHLDRERNLTHMADKARATAIAAKVDELKVRIRARIEDLDIAILILVAGQQVELPELVAGKGDEDRSQLRDLAAEQLAHRADPTYAWGQNREPREQALEALLVMLPAVEVSELAEATA